MTTNLNCPVSVDKVDESIIRVASFITLLTLAVGILFNSALIVFLLAFDFGLRAFTSGKFSPIRALSKNVGFTLKLHKKEIDAAPKRFAAGLGAAFSIIIGLLLVSGNLIFAFAFGIILGICALLEGLFAFCVGCHIYSWIVVPLIKGLQLKGRIT